MNSRLYTAMVVVAVTVCASVHGAQQQCHELWRQEVILCAGFFMYSQCAGLYRAEPLGITPVLRLEHIVDGFNKKDAMNTVDWQELNFWRNELDIWFAEYGPIKSNAAIWRYEGLST